MGRTDVPEISWGDCEEIWAIQPTQISAWVCDTFAQGRDEGNEFAATTGAQSGDDDTNLYEGDGAGFTTLVQKVPPTR